jgi:hypothetical protein
MYQFLNKLQQIPIFGSKNNNSLHRSVYKKLKFHRQFTIAKLKNPFSRGPHSCFSILNFVPTLFPTSLLLLKKVFFSINFATMISSMPFRIALIIIAASGVIATTGSNVATDAGSTQGNHE